MASRVDLVRFLLEEAKSRADVSLVDSVRRPLARRTP
jgi:hypothetical protein